jgi:ABC-type branched-subunit amino acid transport system substrate-binding protein
VVLIAVALLSACSAAPAWRGLIKVGLVLPFHGPDPAAAMATHVAVRQRLIDLNRGGGLAGRRLELVSLDDQNDPAVRALRLRELALDPDVQIVVSDPASLDVALRDLVLRLDP